MIVCTLKRVRLTGKRRRTDYTRLFFTQSTAMTLKNAFRSGQLHVTDSMPINRIDRYRREHPEFLRVDPYLGTYFYRVNVTRPPLNNRLVRRALAMAIDRERIVNRVTHGAQLPASCFTPPNTAGYTCQSSIPYDVDLAHKTLAQAGYPNGRSLPPIEILFNTSENHKLIAEAVQQMWRQNLNVAATLVNQEEKVYFDSRRQMNYRVIRSTWIGDYVDPNSFLDLWVTNGTNNQTGWSIPITIGLLPKPAKLVIKQLDTPHFRRRRQFCSRTPRSCRSIFTPTLF